MKKKLILIGVLLLLTSCIASTPKHFKDYLGEYQDELYVNEKLGFKLGKLTGYEISSADSLRRELEALYEDKTSAERKELDKSRKLFVTRNAALDVSMRIDLEYRKDDPRLDVENYIAHVKEFYKDNQDIQFSFLDHFPYQIANQEYTLLTAFSKSYQRIVYFYLRPTGDYMLVITISTTDTIQGNEAALKLIRSFQEYKID